MSLPTFHIDRAVTLTGKARDITRTRDGYIAAALANGATQKSIVDSTDLDKGNVSRIAGVLKDNPDVSTAAAAVPLTVKGGDPAALTVGNAVADALSAKRATAQRAKKAADDSVAEDTAKGKAENDGPAAPATTGDLILMLAAIRDAARETVWGPTDSATVEGLLADIAAAVAA